MSSPPPGQQGVNVLRGIFFMCVAGILFSGLNGAIKWLGQEYHTIQLIWIRVFGHLVFLVLLFGPGLRWRVFQTNAPRLQLWRSVLALGSNGFYFFALVHLPLADVAVISFTSPFWVAALAIPLLGEKVGWRRWLAIAVGFAGAALVIRPGGAGFHPAAFLVFGSSICYALYQIYTRKAATGDPPEISAVFHPLVGTAVMSALVPFYWTTPSHWFDVALMLSLGVFGGLGHYFVARALFWGPAAAVSPFNYIQLLGAVILGYLLFDHLPTTNTWLGAAVIMSSGLYIVYRERQLDRARQAT